MNELSTLQNFVTGRLRSLDYFSDIAVEAVMFYRQNDKSVTPQTIEERLDRTLKGYETVNGKVGAAIRVLYPVLNVRQPNLPGPKLSLTIPIHVLVNRIQNFGPNGTGKYDQDIAVEITRNTHGFGLWRNGGFIFKLVCDGDTVISYFDDEKKLSCSEVLVHTVYNMEPRTELALPIIAVANGQATITAAAGDVYYTLDGETYPNPDDVGVVQYTGPFAVQSGQQIICIAVQSGSSGSQAASLIIP